MQGEDHAEGDGSKASGVLPSIMSSRFTYAINWYTTATPALSLIAAQYAVPKDLSGLIVSFFFLSVGIFQLPAGALSSRFGSKKVALSGLLLLSLSSIATPFAPDFAVLLAFRFAAGTGSALFFSPAIGVLSSFFRKERRTGVIGLYNASFSVGAGIALLVWPTIIHFAGWQTGVILGGVLSLAACIYSYFAIDMEKAIENPAAGMAPHELLTVFRNRQVWIISLGLVGMWGVYNAVPQFMYSYATQFLGLSTSSLLPGALASIILFVGLFGGIISGPLHRHMSNARSLLVVIVLLFTISLPLFMIRSVPSAIAGSIAIGILFTAGVTITYALPAHMSTINLKNLPLAISLVNSIQVLGGFWVATLFGFVQFHAGFYWAFPAMMVVAIAFLPFYLAMSPKVE